MKLLHAMIRNAFNESINPPAFSTAKSSMQQDNEPDTNGSEGMGSTSDEVAELKFLRNKDIGDTLTPEQQEELDQLRSNDDSSDECDDPECCDPECPTHGECDDDGDSELPASGSSKRLGDMKAGSQRGIGMSSDTLKGIGEGFERADDDSYNPNKTTKLGPKARAAMANKPVAKKEEEEVKTKKPVKKARMSEAASKELADKIAKLNESVLASIDFKFGSSKK